MAVKVRQRKGKPGWWVVIDHKKGRKSVNVADKATAERVAKGIREQLALGKFNLGKPEPRPFDNYYRAWLDSYVRTHCKESTYVSYEVAFRRHLEPYLGNRDLREISRQDTKQIVATMTEKKLSRSTVRATLAPLREMFNHAIEDGHVVSNPAANVLKRSRVERGSMQAADFLTAAELALLLETCLERFPRWHPFVFLLARTGMRLGEATALEWSAVDFNGRFATVHQAHSRGQLTSPKSGKTRQVDLSQRLVEVLRTLHLEQRKAALASGQAVPAWVFTNRNRGPVDADNFRSRTWPKVLAKAGLRKIRIHDLRHTHASLLIGNGESLAYVRDQLGHHSIQITVDTYGHLVPGGNRAAVDRLDEPTQPSATYPQPTDSAADEHTAN